MGGGVVDNPFWQTDRTGTLMVLDTAQGPNNPKLQIKKVLHGTCVSSYSKIELCGLKHHILLIW